LPLADYAHDLEAKINIAGKCSTSAPLRQNGRVEEGSDCLIGCGAPPWMRSLPCHFPDCRDIGARPGDTATSDEVKDLRREASALKEVVAELTLENRLLKKA
jgi:hypothetical protein